MTQTIEQARAAAVAETVGKIREAEARLGVTREGVDAIRDLLLALAGNREFWTFEDFPTPPKGEKASSCMYRLSEDDDHRFALYLNSAWAGYSSPVHDHTVWAVIVGIEGQELNRLYEHDGEGGVRKTGEKTVEAGKGVGFLPDELHAIEAKGEGRVMNFHMYGRGLEQLSGRRYYREDEHDWIHFAAHPDIRDARAPA